MTYTPTADFVLSASDDGNVRIWKARASQKLGPVSVKERNAIEYRQKLVDKWGSAGDVRSVKDRRHVPQSVHNAVKLNREMRDSIRNKEDRRRTHSRASREKPKAERKSECISSGTDCCGMICRGSKRKTRLAGIRTEGLLWALVPRSSEQDIPKATSSKDCELTVAEVMITEQK